MSGPGQGRRIRRSRCALAVVVLLAPLTGSCEEHEFEPPDRAERVQQAETLFTAAEFDTVEWTSEEARLVEGNAVYSARCRQCHGALGQGGTEYALERNLDIPSLVEPDWSYAGDLHAVRRRIFTGHPAGMPTWGQAGLTLREIDATAFYILEGLRPDVIEGGAEIPGGG